MAMNNSRHDLTPSDVRAGMLHPSLLASFTLTVIRLAHRGVQVPVIAKRLARTETEVWDAIRMLSVPLPSDGRDAIAGKMSQ